MSKILAVDYGTKNIGLALSDDDKKISFPYGTISRRYHSAKYEKKALEDINNICRIENVERIVIGMPLNLAGDVSRMGQKVFLFAQELERKLHLKVEVQDERYTTVEAKRLSQKGARNLDELAAQIILDNYLKNMKI